MQRLYVRVLVDEGSDIVDLVVNDHVQVLLGGVGRDFGVGECFFGHGDGI